MLLRRFYISENTNGWSQPSLNPFFHSTYPSCLSSQHQNRKRSRTVCSRPSSRPSLPHGQHLQPEAIKLRDLRHRSSREQ